MLTLDPNPRACQALPDVASSALKALYPNVWADPRTSCLTCAKQGTFTAVVDGQPQEYVCDCTAQWVLHRWMLNAGIGTHYQRLSWSDIRTIPESVVGEVLDYVDQAKVRTAAGTGLTLWSPDRGTGKTLLLALMAKALLAAGVDAYFTTFPDMLDASVSGWRDAEARTWFQRRIRNAGALLIDDVGREHKGRSEVSEAMFDSVIRHRVSNSLPSFLTSNLSPSQMMTGYGPNVLSLLSEVNIEVEVPGADFRPKAREQRQEDLRKGYVRPLVTA